MENFEPNIDIEGDPTKETRAELNEFQKELVKENEPEIEAIKAAISSLKSFEDLRNKKLTINYPASSKEKIDKKKFPKTLDMWPKPSLDKNKKGKRENDKGETVDDPDPLVIYLDNRKFTITPDIGKVSNTVISNGNIILNISKFSVKIRTEIYDPARMTKLLIILWTHKSGLNNDIEGTPRADVREIK